MATHVRESRSPEESLEWSARAIRILEPRLEKDPRDVDARMGLFDTFHGPRVGLAFDWSAVRKPPRTGGGRSNSARASPYQHAALSSLTASFFWGSTSRRRQKSRPSWRKAAPRASNLYMFADVHSLGSAAAANDVACPGGAGEAGRPVRRPGGRVAPDGPGRRLLPHPSSEPPPI